MNEPKNNTHPAPGLEAVAQQEAIQHECARSDVRNVVEAATLDAQRLTGQSCGDGHVLRNGIRYYAPSVGQKPYGVILKSLAHLLTAPRTDAQSDADVMPADLVRAEVAQIRLALDELMKLVPKVDIVQREPAAQNLAETMSEDEKMRCIGAVETVGSWKTFSSLLGENLMLALCRALTSSTGVESTAAPEGHVIVPIQPTQRQLRAATECSVRHFPRACGADYYSAMIAAAQKEKDVG